MKMLDILIEIIQEASPEQRDRLKVAIDEFVDTQPKVWQKNNAGPVADLLEALGFTSDSDSSVYVKLRNIESGVN